MATTAVILKVCPGAHRSQGMLLQKWIGGQISLEMLFSRAFHPLETHIPLEHNKGSEKSCKVSVQSGWHVSHSFLYLIPSHTIIFARTTYKQPISIPIEHTSGSSELNGEARSPFGERRDSCDMTSPCLRECGSVGALGEQCWPRAPKGRYGCGQ